MPASNSDARVLQTPGILANNSNSKGSYQRMNPTIEPEGFVYLILEESNSTWRQKVKIGYSTNPEKRLRSLQTGSASRLSIVNVWRGTPKDEKSIHALLNDYRERLEWFLIDLPDAETAISHVLGNPVYQRINTGFAERWDVLDVSQYQAYFDAVDACLKRMENRKLKNVAVNTSNVRQQLRKATVIIGGYFKYLAGHADLRDVFRFAHRATYKLANACGYCDKLMRYPDIYISSSAQSLRESIIAFAGKVAVMEKQMAGVDFDFRQPAQSVAPQPAPVTA